MADLRALRGSEEGEEQQQGPQAAGQYTMQQLVAFEAARTLEEEAAQRTDRDGWMLTLPEKKTYTGLSLCTVYRLCKLGGWQGWRCDRAPEQHAAQFQEEGQGQGQGQGGISTHRCMGS